jgi:hypothetical protein
MNSELAAPARIALTFSVEHWMFKDSKVQSRARVCGEQKSDHEEIRGWRQVRPKFSSSKKANQDPFLAKSRKEEHSEPPFRSESVKGNEERD